VIQLATQSIRIFLSLSLVVGVLYPMAVTLAGQALWGRQANGSLIQTDHQIVGSELLAQRTESTRLFWPRPSASDYGAVPSGATNWGPTAVALKTAVMERREKGLAAEMLFSSGSGLDPHISYDAAISQLPRIVHSRNLNDIEKQELVDIVEKSIEKRDLGFLGEERINVLRLNLKLIERFGR
jgi:potassium-transporting ATPase KdpC subunit